MSRSQTSRKCFDGLTLEADKSPRRGLRAELERHARDLAEELRLKRYSLTSQHHLHRGLGLVFAHLNENGVRELASVHEEHLVSFARMLQSAKTPHGTPLRPATQSVYLQVVRRFFEFLFRRGLLLHNPAVELKLPVPGLSARRVLTERQAARLMSSPSPSSWRGIRDGAILEILYGTGIRRGECARLDVSDVDLQQGRLLIRDGKGRKDRVIPLVGRAAVALDVYLKDVRPELLRDPSENALFLTRYGRTIRRMSELNVTWLLRKHARAVGIEKIHPHVVRHSCATHLLRRGAGVRHVQELLGHKRLSTTAVYTQVTHQDLLDVLNRAHPRARARGGRKKR